jgi:hypothetical protein
MNQLNAGGGAWRESQFKLPSSHNCRNHSNYPRTHGAGSEGVCRFKAVMSYQSVMRDLKFIRCGRGTLYVMRVKTSDPWQSQQTSLEDAGRVIPPVSSLLRLGHVQSVCQSDATGDEIFLQVNPNKTFTELLDPKED